MEYAVKQQEIIGVLSEVGVIALFTVPSVQCGCDGARELGHSDNHPHALLISRRFTFEPDLPRR